MFIDCGMLSRANQQCSHDSWATTITTTFTHVTHRDAIMQRRATVTAFVAAIHLQVGVPSESHASSKSAW